MILYGTWFWHSEQSLISSNFLRPNLAPLGLSLTAVSGASSRISNWEEEWAREGAGRAAQWPKTCACTHTDAHKCIYSSRCLSDHALVLSPSRTPSYAPHRNASRPAPSREGLAGIYQLNGRPQAISPTIYQCNCGWLVIHR